MVNFTTYTKLKENSDYTLDEGHIFVLRSSGSNSGRIPYGKQMSLGEKYETT
jgi:hypothetical protein